MTVKVSETDIKRGRKWSLDQCPLGRAVQRLHPNNRIRVGYNFVSVETHDSDPSQYRLFYVPQDVIEKIHAFENGERIEPYECFLEEVPRKNKSAEAIDS